MIAAAWRGAAQIGTPALRLMLRRRATRGKENRARLPEREGLDTTPRPEGRLLWLHAASVGESVSVLPVLTALQARAPELSVLFTTGTLTSATLLEQRLPDLGLDRVLHRFVPLDVPSWSARFLDHWRPNAAVFVESELWPNMLAACQARRIPLMLVNARMSARSFRSWYRVPGFARQIIGAFDRIHPQSPEYAERLRLLGARTLESPGNLKFAAPRLPVDEAELARLRAQIGIRPVWLAASAHPGEEAVAAEVHRRVSKAWPGLLTIVAPRHPGRGAEMATALGDAPRRACGAPPPPGGIWVADTLGELGLLYRLAPIVFMGRSLVGRGGQNPLEAARFGCALATGPHTGNFTDVVARLREAGGLCEVADAPELAAWLDAMLRDPSRRDEAGQAALRMANCESALPDRIAASWLELMR